MGGKHSLRSVLASMQSTRCCILLCSSSSLPAPSPLCRRAAAVDMWRHVRAAEGLRRLACPLAAAAATTWAAAPSQRRERLVPLTSSMWVRRARRCMCHPEDDDTVHASRSRCFPPVVFFRIFPLDKLVSCSVHVQSARRDKRAAVSTFPLHHPTHLAVDSPHVNALTRIHTGARGCAHGILGRGTSKEGRRSEQKENGNWGRGEEKGGGGGAERAGNASRPRQVYKANTRLSHRKSREERESRGTEEPRHNGELCDTWRRLHGGRGGVGGGGSRWELREEGKPRDTKEKCRTVTAGLPA